MRSMKYLKHTLFVTVIILSGLMIYVYYPEKTQGSSEAPIKSPGIKLLPYSEDYIDEFDVGFRKWIVVFENFNAENLDSCEMQRSFSFHPEELGSFVSIRNYLKADVLFSNNAPLIKTKSGASIAFPEHSFILVLSAKGFLPGEKITLRAKTMTSSDYEMISFCPRPITVTDTHGKELIFAQLQALNPTSYEMNIAYDPKNPLIRFCSHSEKERLSNFFFQQEPIVMGYSPDVHGKEGGFSLVRLTYQNGDTYELEFPWGNELNPYMLGSK